MGSDYTRRSAFSFFGTKPRNIQWSWSARNETTKTVVVTLWKDLLKKEESGFCYRNPKPPAEVARRLGHGELIENLIWARENCEGRFNVIVAVARDPSEDPRKVAECYPIKTVMQLADFDPVSGSFTAHSVLPTPAPVARRNGSQNARV